jgi:hypothetical protein
MLEASHHGWPWEEKVGLLSLNVDCAPAWAGYRLTRVLPGTLGLRLFASSDEAKFFSVAPLPLRIAALQG